MDNETSTNSTIEQGFVLHPKYAESYLQRAIPQYNWDLEQINKHDFKGMSRIIDLGCRNGVAAMEIARRVPGSHVIGIDFSVQMLSLANENLARHTVPNLEFRLLSPVEMDFHHSVDAVISVSYLHWIENKLEVLKAIQRSLRPSGHAFLSFFADHQRERFDWCITTVAAQDKWKNYFVDYNPLIKLVTAYQFAAQVYKSGLILQRLEFVKRHDVFVSKLQFMDWFTTWCDDLKYLPEELHYVFLSEVVDKHLERYPPDAKGQIHCFDYMLEADLLNT